MMIAVITFGRPVVSQTINKKERKKNSVDLKIFGNIRQLGLFIELIEFFTIF